MTKRTLQFFLFFSIALTLYGLLNAYIFIRGLEVISPFPHLRPVYFFLYTFLSLSFVAGRFLERLTLSWLSSTLVWIGSFWLAGFVYFYVIALFIDLLRLLNHIIPFFPAFVARDLTQTKLVTGGVVVALVVLVVVLGHLNTLKPRIKLINLEIPKNSRTLKSLNLAVASDIHLGTIISKSRLEHIVSELNALDPDLVLLPGDVVDEDLGPVIRRNLGEILRTIKSKYGVFAITGNHEYIGGVEEACKYLGEHGITVLRDDVVTVGDSVVVVGREDRSIRQFTGKARKPLNELMAAVDKSLPILLMDHQPFKLDEAVHNGVDLQLSGHTHHGQLWPFNFISKKIFELSWGYKRKGNTHFYVSCGVGTWGPPVRTGNRPEIINLKIRFT
ncbi:MAG: metallophosphoesterase [Bacteroidota bacterium]